jgi:hypothetical protein
MRGHRIGVDHRSDGIGGIVEAVHEFEAERDQQRQPEESEHPSASSSPTPRVSVSTLQPGKSQPARHDRREQQFGQGMGLVVETGPRLRLVNRGGLVQSE